MKKSFVLIAAIVGLLAATASTASADRILSTWYCPPATPPATSIFQLPAGCAGPVVRSFDFGDRQVGTTSPVQRFALGVYCLPNSSCNDTLNPSIGVPGDYAQTNNCPATLSAAAPGQLQGCIIEVTFTPTGTGPREGTLSTGSGGPSLTLTGNGVSTPTPPALPLLLSADYDSGTYSRKALLKKRLTLFATTNYDSTLVVRGGVKKTVAQVTARKWTEIKAKLKHLRRLKESTKPRVKIKFAATDEFGQRATDELKIEFQHKG